MGSRLGMERQPGRLTMSQEDRRLLATRAGDCAGRWSSTCTRRSQPDDDGRAGLKLVALNMGPGPLGEVAFALGLLGLFELVSDLGFGLAHIKLVSEGRPLERLLGTYLLLRILLVLLMVGLFYASLWLWLGLTGTLFEGSTTMGIVHVVVLYYIFNALILVPTTTFDGLQRTALSQGGFLVQHPVKFAVIALTAVLGLGSFYLATAYALASAAGLVVVWVIYLRHRFPIGAPDLSLVRPYLRYALPLMVGSLFGTVVLNTDRVMLGFFWDQVQVGWYFGVQRVTAVLLVATSALSVLLFPQISSLLSARREAEARSLVLAAERYLSIVVVPLAAILVVLGPAVITVVLAATFLPAATSMSFLALAVVGSALVMPRINYLRGAGRLAVAAGVSGLIAGANVVFNLLLVPKGAPVLAIPGLREIPLEGSTGSAAATLIATMVGLAVAWALTSSRDAVGPPRRCHLVHGAAALAAALVVLVASDFGALATRWYTLGLWSLALLGIYAALLWAARELRPADVRFFWALLSPREMGRYVRTELRGPGRAAIVAADDE